MSLATRLSCELVICPLSELSAGMNDTGNAVPEVIYDVLKPGNTEVGMDAAPTIWLPCRF
jgi:hypothetical protein